MARRWFLGMLVAACTMNAQEVIKPVQKGNDIKLSTLPYYNFGKGVGLTSPDSLFQMNIRFRMQNRVTYTDNEGETSKFAGEIRRLRLRLDGYVGDPRFLYAIQLSFAPGDTGEMMEGENLNIIRDAVVMYRPNKRWNFSFGQTKLPGNRQRLNSSGALQLTDRSINNAKFTIDRDFGFQIHQLNQFSDRFSYNFKAAVSTGEGRNITGNADNALAYTGKIELFPLGDFASDGSNFEGDQKREQTPKFMVSGAFQQNNRALRTGGQLGEYLHRPVTMQSVFADAIFKYKGWALMGAYMARTTTKDPITIHPDDPEDVRYVFTGHGYDAQASYLFPSNYEIIGRYSSQKVNREIRHLAPDTDQYSLGLTRYFWEHSFKIQAEVTYDRLNYHYASNRDNFYVRFQVEIGI